MEIYVSCELFQRFAGHPGLEELCCRLHRDRGGLCRGRRGEAKRLSRDRDRVKEISFRSNQLIINIINIINSYCFIIILMSKVHDSFLCWCVNVFYVFETGGEGGH